MLPGADGAGQSAEEQKGAAEVKYPPVLPGGKVVVTDTSDEFLKAPSTLKQGVAVARTAPTIDFLYFPGQTYAGRPWSAWGDSLIAGGKYYASIGDHLAPAGNAFVYEYDPAKKALRQLVDVRKVLDLPDGHYTPGKIHGRLDLGDDGWLYFSTHRGSTTVTTDRYHYKGDWILRHNPATGQTEVVACGPVPKHCIPCSVLDPKRLIFYGGTTPGDRADDEGLQFFAYDLRNRKVLYAGPDGPSRYMIFARSTGRVYYTPSKDGEGPLLRYDPEHGGPPVKLAGTIGLRAATQETPQGFVYTVSQGRKGVDATLYAFNTKTEEVQRLGSAAVGTQSYIASLDADPTGRYLYYIPGAHGGSDTDGSPVVQFDVKTKQTKVIAFLHPFYKDKVGCALKGTYSSAIDATGKTLTITWNANRGSRAWDTCALTVVHIPEAERRP
jgi:hypothetical protein